MTAKEKLLQKLVFMVTGERMDNPDEIIASYNSLHGSDDCDVCDAICEAESELRSGGVDTGLPCDGSRHYESKSVAARMIDGSWVGWTYWYGGGKHGEPGSMPWIDDAYDVQMTEAQRIVMEFKRAEDSKP